MSIFLIVQRGSEIGKRYDLPDAVTTIGRSEDNDITFDDPYVSRYHAVIKQTGSEMSVIDLGSENPVLIRDTPLEPGEPYSLKNRDIVRIGQSVLCYVDTAQAPARPVAPPKSESAPASSPVISSPSTNTAAPADALVPGSFKPSEVAATQVDSIASGPVEKPSDSYDSNATMLETDYSALRNPVSAESAADSTGSAITNITGSETDWAGASTGQYSQSASYSYNNPPTQTEDQTVAGNWPTQPPPSPPYNQPQYNQYNQPPPYQYQYNQPQYGQYPPQTPYQYGQQYGQYPQPGPGQEPPAQAETQVAHFNPPPAEAKSDETVKPQTWPAETKEDEVDPGDAPTTIIRIDKTKL